MTFGIVLLLVLLVLPGALSQTFQHFRQQGAALVACPAFVKRDIFFPKRSHRSP
jgi:hypothetical protein